MSAIEEKAIVFGHVVQYYGDPASAVYQQHIIIQAQTAGLDKLYAENATLSESVTSQALLIDSLKEEIDRMRASLVKRGIECEEAAALLSDARAALKWWGDGKREELEAQLSDTQRQNAELMQRVGEAEKDAERWNLYAATGYPRPNVSAVSSGLKYSSWTQMIRGVHVNFGSANYAIDAAIAASKVSNEVASKGDE